MPRRVAHPSPERAIVASDQQLPPLVAAAYLVVTGEQNPAILDEFLHSFTSLRRHHPDLPVFVYHANLTDQQLTFLRRLRNVMDFSIGIDGHRFAPHHWRMKHGLLPYACLISHQ